MKAQEKKSTRTNHGNPYVKRILCEVAWSVTRNRNSYLASWYWRVKQRRGAKKAIIALARKLLVIIYTMFKTNAQYDETAFEIAKTKQEAFRVKKILAEAHKLGLELVVPKKPA
jgi:transposase